MPKVRVELDTETYQQLVAQAVSERRPVVFQAEILIRRGLGLPLQHLEKPLEVPRCK